MTGPKPRDTDDDEVKERRRQGDAVTRCPHCDRFIADDHFARHLKSHADDEDLRSKREQHERERPPPGKRRSDQR